MAIRFVFQLRSVAGWGVLFVLLRWTCLLYTSCLSIPGATAEVIRPSYVKVKALNRNGEEITVEGKDLMARALCHEIDHLDGILYVDKAVGKIEY